MHLYSSPIHTGEERGLRPQKWARNAPGCDKRTLRGFRQRGCGGRGGRGGPVTPLNHCSSSEWRRAAERPEHRPRAPAPSDCVCVQNKRRWSPVRVQTGRSWSAPRLRNETPPSVGTPGRLRGLFPSSQSVLLCDFLPTWRVHNPVSVADCVRRDNWSQFVGFGTQQGPVPEPPPPEAKWLIS